MFIQENFIQNYSLFLLNLPKSIYRLLHSILLQFVHSIKTSLFPGLNHRGLSHISSHSASHFPIAVFCILSVWLCAYIVDSFQGSLLKLPNFEYPEINNDNDWCPSNVPQISLDGARKFMNSSPKTLRGNSKYKIGFCNMQKVCSTFGVSILSYLEGRYKNLNWELNLNDVGFVLTPSDLFGNDSWRGLMFVRDPVDRFISAYADKCLRENFKLIEYLKSYKVLKCGGPSAQFHKEVENYYSEFLPSEDILRMRELFSLKTNHTTSGTSLKELATKQIMGGDWRMLDCLLKIYHADFQLLGFMQEYDAYKNIVKDLKSGSSK